MTYHLFFKPAWLALVAVAFIATNVRGSDSASNTACACEELQARFPKSLLTADSPDYTTERKNYWDVRSDLYPTCIFLPTRTEQVADAVGIFRKCDAQFAIRGGGHMNVRHPNFLCSILSDPWPSIPAPIISMVESCSH
jgi:hypothetical protein